MNRIVMTMPIKPQIETNIGMYIAPTFMNVIGDYIGCETVFSINLLNSYTNKDDCLNTFIDNINQAGIEYDHLFIDKEHVEKIIHLINDMIATNIIKEKYKEKYICDCGKVDMNGDSLDNYINGKLFFKKSNEIYCKSCLSVCKLINKKSLVIELDSNVNDSVSIVPIFLKKETDNFSKCFKGTDYLVSKERDTGYSVVCNGHNYFVDIDFLWMNYHNLFKVEQKILLASNHQLYQMYIMNYINNISNGGSLIFIANPYISNGKVISPIEEFNKTADPFYKKLFILYNTKWRNKDCQWSQSVIDYLSTISNTRRINLYKDIMVKNQADDSVIEAEFNNFLINNINMQKNIVNSKIKRI